MQALFVKKIKKVYKYLKYKEIKFKKILEKDLYIKMLSVNEYIFFRESRIKI